MTREFCSSSLVHDLGGIVQRSDLKQVKNAIAEAHNQNACLLVEVYGSHCGPSLVEEVLGAHAPPTSCRAGGIRMPGDVFGPFHRGVFMMLMLHEL